MTEQDVYILGIESSCDETAAAVVKNGKEVLSNIISTQIPIHRKFGGVVPEIASRKHIERIMPVIDKALDDAKLTMADITAVAVTYGPGLVGALLVGLSAGKALAFACDKPLIGVNHLEGHVIVEPIVQEEKTESGIYLPDTAHKDKPQTGKVIAVGSGRLTDDGKRIPSEVKAGDTVVFAKYSGSDVQLDGKDYIILKDSDILAILVEDTKAKKAKK